MPEFGDHVREAWADAVPVTTDTTLTILGHPVMERWETPYMSALADVVTPTPGCEVLEVGYGMGISAGFVQARSPSRHVVVEANAAVAKAGRAAHPGCDIVGGYWEDVVPTLPDRSFDGILMDTYPITGNGGAPGDRDEAGEFFREAARLLRVGGVLTFYLNDTSNVEVVEAILTALGFDVDLRAFSEVDAPDACEYWDPACKRAIVPRCVLTSRHASHSDALRAADDLFEEEEEEEGRLPDPPIPE